MSTEGPGLAPVVREASVSDEPLSVDRLLGLVTRPAGGRRSPCSSGWSATTTAVPTSPPWTTPSTPAAATVLADCAARTADQHDVVEHRRPAPDRPPRGRRPGGGRRRRCRAPSRGAGRLRAPDQHPQGRGADLEGTALRLRRRRVGRAAGSEPAVLPHDPADLDGVRLGVLLRGAGRAPRGRAGAVRQLEPRRHPRHPRQRRERADHQGPRHRPPIRPPAGST